MRRVLFACMAMIACLTHAMGQGAEIKRFALVVGNASYKAVPALANPGRDAMAIGELLKEAGFDTSVHFDLTLGGMRDAVAGFRRKLTQAGPNAVALVYYAGHAVQLDGTNFLLPVETKLAKDAPIDGNAISLSDVLKVLDESSATSKIVILDACRDNPFLGPRGVAPEGLTLADAAFRGISGQRGETGLARIESRGGTLVAFSTSPGATAYDGSGLNSPFATAFLETARQPGLTIDQVLRRVRVAVHETTGGRQTPWESSSLVSDVVIFGQADRNAASPVVPTEEGMKRLDPAQAYREAVAWNTPAALQDYLSAHPESPQALRAHALLSKRQEEMNWASARSAGAIEDFDTFLNAHPRSQYALLARDRRARAQSRIARLAACSMPVSIPAPQRNSPRGRRAADNIPGPPGWRGRGVYVIEEDVPRFDRRPRLNMGGPRSFDPARGAGGSGGGGSTGGGSGGGNTR